MQTQSINSVSSRTDQSPSNSGGHFRRLNAIDANSQNEWRVLAWKSPKGCGVHPGEIARLGHVTPARLSQIMNLLTLSPDIQEAILFLPRVDKGRDRVTECDLRRVVRSLDWGVQRAEWKTPKRCLAKPMTRKSSGCNGCSNYVSGVSR